MEKKAKLLSNLKENIRMEPKVKRNNNIEFSPTLRDFDSDSSDSDSELEPDR
jgi:hypothetical protein